MHSSSAVHPSNAVHKDILQDYESIIELSPELKNDLKYNKSNRITRPFYKATKHKYNIDDLVRLHVCKRRYMYHDLVDDVMNVLDLIDSKRTNFVVKDISHSDYESLNVFIEYIVNKREKIQNILVSIILRLERYKNLKYKLFDHHDLYILRNVCTLIPLNEWNNFINIIDKEIHDSLSECCIEDALFYKHYKTLDSMLKEEFLFFSEMVDLIKRDRISFVAFLIGELNTNVVQKIFEYI